jgi:hypothetical protein
VQIVEEDDDVPELDDEQLSHPEHEHEHEHEEDDDEEVVVESQSSCFFTKICKINTHITAEIIRIHEGL